jgi:type VI secretion system protein ImpG
MDALGAAGYQDAAEILFLISPFERASRHELLETAVGARTLRLGCSPLINLFPQTAEPIQLDRTRYEYPVMPDYRHSRSVEVFSVDEVTCTYQRTGESVPFEPFFSFRHGMAPKQPGFWQATRRPAGPDERSTRMWLSLVELSGRPLALDLDTLTVRCTCSNGDMPARLPFGEERGDFDLEGGSAIDRIVALRKPTPVLRPAVGHDALWRLISHLSLNYLSLVEGGREALQEMLRLYHCGSASLEQQIEGIADVRSERRFTRVVGDHGIAYVRGMRVELRLDEKKFVGGGAYLFASVLERYFGQYVSMNSFSQLAVSTPQRKEMLREWEPRSGNRILM